VVKKLLRRIKAGPNYVGVPAFSKRLINYTAGISIPTGFTAFIFCHPIPPKKLLNITLCKNAVTLSLLNSLFRKFTS
jgi:hypothetical protein